MGEIMGEMAYPDLFAKHMADSLPAAGYACKRRRDVPVRTQSFAERVSSAPSITSSFGGMEDAMLTSHVLPWASADTHLARVAPFVFSRDVALAREVRMGRKRWVGKGHKGRGAA